MRISAQNSPVFQRRLKTSEEAEYSDVLKRGRAKACGSENGRNILIIPASSLPLSEKNNTGVGNLASSDGQKFMDFAKKYWGINEIQLLPVGQYFNDNGTYMYYGGSSMNFGNHMINLSDYLTQEELKKVIDSNKVNDVVNFSNVVEKDSEAEKLLLNFYKRISPEMKQEFEAYKVENADILDRKGLFRALTEIYGTYHHKRWNDVDCNLFNDDIVSKEVREKRIEEINELKSEMIDFFKFKDFLASKSLKKAKTELNAKGIKLHGDMPCGFAKEEVWAHPKAFIKDSKMSNWKFPVLDMSSTEAETILRQKVRMYAKNFDGFRVDASWTYVEPNVYNYVTKAKSKPDYGDYFLKIIDDEVKRVKGNDFDLNNVMHEFAANPYKEFDIHNAGGSLKSLVRDRVKIYTSDSLSDDWGSANAYLERHWNDDKFIIGATNHDSKPMNPTDKQIKALAKILKLEPEKLKNRVEFIKAKFAEPMRAKNNMVFFLHALGLHEDFRHNDNKKYDWARNVPENYEDVYFSSLNKGNAFNPMDALEKQFIAQGLDKSEPELFKKIVKFRKILEKKEGTPVWVKIGAVVSGLALVGFALYKYTNQKLTNVQS